MVDVLVERRRVRRTSVGVHCIEDHGDSEKEVIFHVVIFGVIRSVGVGDSEHSQRHPTVSSRPMEYGTRYLDLVLSLVHHSILLSGSIYS